MRLKNNLLVKLGILSGLFSVPFAAQASQLETGVSTLHQMTGCYLVDYSYTETESLQAGYNLDKRVYDVNKDKSVKEWIFAEDISPTRVRLQHILFATDLAGNFMQGSMLKHQAEDWIYNADFVYDFVSPSRWLVKGTTQPGAWTRRITNLDDGLRYQCSANWLENTAYPEWTCDNFAPIPGRETRDMGRKDYNTLDRSTRLIAYGNNWLERQANTKVNFTSGVKNSFAKEVGKNWYVRLPDSHCSEAQEFTRQRNVIWTVLREVWDEVLDGKQTFVEKNPAGAPPRYVRVWDVEKRYMSQNLNDPAVVSAAQNDIKAIIAAYREAE